MTALRTLTEVARALSVPEKTVRIWVASGRLKAYKLGRHLRFRDEDVEAFVEERKVVVEQAPPIPLWAERALREK